MMEPVSTIEPAFRMPDLRNVSALSPIVRAAVCAVL